LTECGKSVPNDVSVIGFDDIPMAKMFIPQLTTIKQDIKSKGVTAARSLLETIDENAVKDPMKILLPLELVERQTVKKLNKS
jgi:DNA-binding LacI/PurR family transcriptional regulator